MYFVCDGYKTEVRRLMEQLVDEQSCDSLVLVGPHGAGKSLVVDAVLDDMEGEGVVVPQQAVAGALDVELLAHLGGRGDHRAVGEGAAVDPLDAFAGLTDLLTQPQGLADVDGEPQGQGAGADDEGGAQPAEPPGAGFAEGELAVEEVGALAVDALPPAVGRAGGDGERDYPCDESQTGHQNWPEPQPRRLQRVRCQHRGPPGPAAGLQCRVQGGLGRHGIERAPLARFVDALRAENGHV